MFFRGGQSAMPERNASGAADRDELPRRIAVDGKAL
jgi:hypothetical protein